MILISLGASLLSACFGLPLCPSSTPNGWALWVDDRSAGANNEATCRESITGPDGTMPYAGYGCVSQAELRGGCESICRAYAASDQAFESCSVSRSDGRPVVLCQGTFQSSQCPGGP